MVASASQLPVFTIRQARLPDGSSLVGRVQKCYKMSRSRVRRFRFKNFFASKRNEAKRDPFRMRFARSREKKLLFFRFISLLFASNFSLPTKAK